MQSIDEKLSLEIEPREFHLRLNWIFLFHFHIFKTIFVSIFLIQSDSKSPREKKKVFSCFFGGDLKDKFTKAKLQSQVLFRLLIRGFKN